MRPQVTQQPAVSPARGAQLTPLHASAWEWGESRAPRGHLSLSYLCVCVCVCVCVCCQVLPSLQCEEGLEMTVIPPG